MLTRFPGKIIRIDRNAVATQARTRIERHETERLGGGGIDHFPDIDIHAGRKEFQFVDQRDVDATKNIFKKLGHFRGASRTDRNHFGDHLRVKCERRAAAGRIDAADNFGNLRQAVLLVAGIFAFRRKRQEEVGRNVVALEAGGNGEGHFPGWFPDKWCSLKSQAARGATFAKFYEKPDRYKKYRDLLFY